MPNGLTRDEGIAVEKTIGVLSALRDRLEWLNGAEFYDEAMKQREIDSVRRQLTEAADGLPKVAP